MITQAKPWLPSRDALNRYLDGIYERGWLTNNGPLVQELTRRLQAWLGVEHLLLVGSGTLALQVAFRALGVDVPLNGKPAEAITTPFSFVATASALKWQGIEPVFVDIDPHSWNLDARQIASAVTPQTRAIVPVHVFGNACEVELIQAVAQQHDLQVIYDAAHAFGVDYRGQSLLNWGDAATLSFHATKAFHTVEGGAIVFKRAEDLQRAQKIINFGQSSPGCVDELGINAKMSELHAAMGLCVLDDMEANLAWRKRFWETYRQAFDKRFTLQRWNPFASLSCTYFPLLMDSEQQLLGVMHRLAAQGVQTRRYFYPSLDSVASLGNHAPQKNSIDIAARILCLPLHAELVDADMLRIIAGVRGE